MKGLIPIISFLYLISFWANAHPGVGIVMDSKGNVFYTDLKQIWKIDEQGRKSIVVRNVHSHELYMDEYDHLYGEHLWYEGATSKWSHFVWRFSADGGYEKIIPDTAGFLQQYSFVRDHQGNMYWADRTGECQQVIRKDKNGVIKQFSNACLKDIRWMNATPAGDVYLIDGFDLKKVDQLNNVTTLARHLEENSKTTFAANDPHLIMGLNASYQGDVFIAVYGGAKVKKVEPNGTITTVAETNHQWLPIGVLNSTDGDLWILECSPANEVRVERFTKDNQRIVY